MINLVDALCAGKTPRLAFVGSGGKTTILFRLARTLNTPVIVTTTTHLAIDQLAFADHYVQIANHKDLTTFLGQKIQGVTLVTGPKIEGDRVKGVGVEILKNILTLTNAQEYPLLIEADGSRMLPLKAPGDHEPAIPSLESTRDRGSWLDGVIVVAGLSGLNKSLTSVWVHRPERFAELSGLDLGAQIDSEALRHVLIHPSGGLKNIPENTKRILFLNQADTIDLQAQAQRIVRGSSGVSSILSAYHAGIIASMTESRIYAVYKSVAGIVLAAGGSSRFGEPKQLLNWHGKPFVRHVVQNALTLGLNPVIIVTGDYGSQVGDAVEDLEVVILHNHNWREGQSTSVKIAIEALPGEAGAAVFLLADQPQISIELIHKLVETYASSNSPIVAPQIAGRRGNPVLFDRVTFPDLQRISGDMGGRQVFSKYPITWVPWHDSTALLDVDTPEDYRKFVEMT